MKIEGKFRMILVDMDGNVVDEYVLGRADGQWVVVDDDAEEGYSNVFSTTIDHDLTVYRNQRDED